MFPYNSLHLSSWNDTVLIPIIRMAIKLLGAYQLHIQPTMSGLCSSWSHINNSLPLPISPTRTPLKANKHGCYFLADNEEKWLLTQGIGVERLPGGLAEQRKTQLLPSSPVSLEESMRMKEIYEQCKHLLVYSSGGPPGIFPANCHGRCFQAWREAWRGQPWVRLPYPIWNWSFSLSATELEIIPSSGLSLIHWWDLETIWGLDVDTVWVGRPKIKSVLSTKSKRGKKRSLDSYSFCPILGLGRVH